MRSQRSISKKIQFDWFQVIEFRVAFLEKLNDSLKISKVALPNALLPGQVLVKLQSFGVCGSQLLEISGKKGNARFIPHMLGHEGVGIVVECGDLVSTVQEGDRVVLHWRKGTGIEGPPAEYLLPDGRKLGSGPISTFGEMTVVSENRLTVIPSDIGSTLATLLGCGLSTGLAAVDKEVQLRLGDSVLVFGAGGVGMSAAIGSALKGAGTLVVADSNSQKASPVANIPGARFTCTAEEGWEAGVRSASPQGFDVVVEASGSPDVRKIATAFLAASGQLVVLGQGDGEEMVELGPQKLAFGSNGGRVIFSQGGGFQPDLDIPKYARKLANFPNLVEAISHSYSGPLEGVNDAIGMLREGKVGRPILNLQS